MPRRITLATAYDPTHNNFDFLRFVLAALVLWSHSYSLDGQPDPLRRLTGTLEGGRLGVEGFFAVSGFLVTQSWHRSDGGRIFAAKRALRVFPALLAALVFSALLVGPLVSSRSLADYFGWSRPWLMFAGVFLHRFLAIPDTFAGNAFAGHVNASLWTLRYELVCYGLVAALGLLGRAPRLLGLLAISGLALALTAVGPEKALFGDARYWLPRLGAFFTAGMLLYELRARVPVTGWSVTIAAALLLASVGLGEHAVLLPTAGTYLLLVAACTPRLPVAGFGRHGDFSYGLYVYAYPIQQTVLYVAGGHLAPWLVLAWSFPATLGLAVASWHLIEAPALARKPRSVAAAEPEAAAQAAERARTSRS